MSWRPTRPVICLVTDRGRLAAGGDPEHLVEAIRLAGAAGVDLVQIREPDLDDSRLLDLVIGAVDATAHTATRIIVNDRLDVALAGGAAGVHLKGSAYAADRVRQIAPASFVVGRSVRSPAEARAATAAGALDYLILGTIYATSSKAGQAPAGLEVLRAVVEAVSIPVLAIGGVTVPRSLEIARTGAAGLAAIGLFADALRHPGTGLPTVVGGIRQAFRH